MFYMRTFARMVYNTGPTEDYFARDTVIVSVRMRNPSIFSHNDKTI